MPRAEKIEINRFTVCQAQRDRSTPVQYEIKLEFGERRPQEKLRSRQRVQMELRIQPAVARICHALIVVAYGYAVNIAIPAVYAVNDAPALCGSGTTRA